MRPSLPVRYSEAEIVVIQENIRFLPAVAPAGCTSAVLC